MVLGSEYGLDIILLTDMIHFMKNEEFTEEMKILRSVRRQKTNEVVEERTGGAKCLLRD